MDEMIRSAGDWLQLIGIGILLGALGQGMRSIIGMKKLNDEAAEKKTDFADLFSPTRLFVSLLIGAIAGAFTSVLIIGDLAKLSAEQILGLAAAGYAGTDTIEALMSRVLPQTPTVPVVAAAPAVVAAVQPQVITLQAPAPIVTASTAVDDYQG